MTDSQERPGYLHRLLAMGQTLRGGKVLDVEVQHDNWCDLLNRKGPCNCHPDMVVRELDRDS